MHLRSTSYYTGTHRKTYGIGVSEIPSDVLILNVRASLRDADIGLNNSHNCQYCLVKIVQYKFKRTVMFVY